MLANTIATFRGARLFRLILLFWAITASASSHGAEGLDFSIHQNYLSTRAIGMGNAFAAVVDDHSAIFYNPAALARREDTRLHFYVGAGLTQDYPKFIQDIQNASNISDQNAKVDALTNLITSNYGKDYYSRVPTLGAFWVKPHWGLAFIPADLTINAGIHRQVGPMVNVTAYQDSTLALSYARDLKILPKDHRLSLGATIKAVNRISANRAISAGELSSDSNLFDVKDANEGFTVDADMGTLYSPPVPTKGTFSFLNFMRPTFAVVAHNIVDYGFPTNFHLVRGDSSNPAKLGRRFDIGTKFDLPKLWVFEPHLAYDVRDIGHSDWTFAKGSHLGFELGWKMYNWWQGTWSAGLNQGYFSAGFGAKLAWFQLNIATWGEEVGTSGASQENRRYIAELSIDI